MKMLTVSLLVCAMMALALAVDEEIPVDKELNNTATLQHLCPDGFSHYEGRCYRFVPDLLTWAEAEENCLNMTANLASVHNQDEDVAIYMIIKAENPNNPESWIGGSDCQKDNVWLWSDGTAFVHTNWVTSKVAGYKHGCIVVNYGAKIQWDDRECSQVFPSVCALDMGDVLQTPSSPTPAGVTE